jgi:hypothetical protein
MEEVIARLKDLKYVLSAESNLRSRLIRDREILITFLEFITNLTYGDLEIQEPDKKEFFSERRTLMVKLSDAKSLSSAHKLIAKQGNVFFDTLLEVLSDYV